MTSLREWQERQQQWAAFHRWEKQQPLIERDPSDIVADLGAIIDWLPAETLAGDPDPEKRGVQELRAAFERMKARK